MRELTPLSPADKTTLIECYGVCFFLFVFFFLTAQTSTLQFLKKWRKVSQKVLRVENAEIPESKKKIPLI